MTQTEMPLKEDVRLSYSSGSLLKNCEQKYQYYKVEKVKKDADSLARDDSHFAIGKSFHYVLETSMHEKPEKIVNALEKCVQTEGLKEEYIGLIHGMVLCYLRLRKDSHLKAVACEHSIQDPKVIGFIDLIEVDETNGNWYISDLKTAATFYESKIPELANDTQLNLYASFYKEIAKAYDLDPDKFQGVRYLVTTKSKAVQQAKESYNEYVMRLVNKKHVKSIFVTIPKALMRIEATRKEHLGLYDRSQALREGAKASRNYTYCNAFFRSCDYFSRCHGMQHSEFLEENTIIVEKTK